MDSAVSYPVWWRRSIHRYGVRQLPREKQSTLLSMECADRRMYVVALENLRNNVSRLTDPRVGPGIHSSTSESAHICTYACLFFTSYFVTCAPTTVSPVSSRLQMKKWCFQGRRPTMSRTQGRLNLGGVNGMGATRSECLPHWNGERGEVGGVGGVGGIKCYTRTEQNGTVPWFRRRTRQPYSFVL